VASDNTRKRRCLRALRMLTANNSLGDFLAAVTALNRFAQQ